MLRSNNVLTSATEQLSLYPTPPILPGLETSYRLMKAISFKLINLGNPPFFLLLLKFGPVYLQCFILPNCNLRRILDLSRLFFFLLFEEKNLLVDLKYTRVQHRPMDSTPRRKKESVFPAPCWWAPSIRCPYKGQFSHTNNYSKEAGNYLRTFDVSWEIVQKSHLWLLKLWQFRCLRRINYFPPSCCHPLVLPYISPRENLGAPVKDRNDSYPSATFSVCYLPPVEFSAWW